MISLTPMLLLLAALSSAFLAWVVWAVALERAPDDPGRDHTGIAIKDVAIASMLTLTALALATAFVLSVR